jgi:hypothetical protein
MKQINLQGFFSDLYRDLRDRRLLLPIAGLAIAIVAVPMLLGGGSSATVPPPGAPLDPDVGAEVEPAVLASQPGVRDYRKRLAELKETNPFVQRFSAPNPAEAALESIVPETDDTSAPSAGGGTVTDTSASTSTSDPSTSSGATSAIPDSSETPADDTTTEPTESKPTKPDVRYVVGRVDVSFGEPKDAKVLEDVRELEFIPGDKNPILAFIGLAGNGDHAVFGLTPDVTETDGEGSCSPKKPDPCQFLRLGEGETRYLKTSGGETFKLKLLATHLVGVQPDAGHK